MRKYIQQYICNVCKYVCVFVCVRMCNLLGFALLFATIANMCEFSGKDAVKFNLPHVEKLKKTVKIYVDSRR